MTQTEAQSIKRLSKYFVSKFVEEKYDYMFSWQDIEDIAGEAMLRACRSWHKFDAEKGPLGAWVKKICRRTVLDWVDYVSKRKDINGDMYPVGGKNDEEIDIDEAGGFMTYRGDEYETDRGLMYSEFEAKVREVINKTLTDKEKELEEHIEQELKPREIAELTGEKASTIAVRKCRVLDKLAEPLAMIGKEYGITMDMKMAG